MQLRKYNGLEAFKRLLEGKIVRHDYTYINGREELKDTCYYKVEDRYYIGHEKQPVFCHFEKHPSISNWKIITIAFESVRYLLDENWRDATQEEIDELIKLSQVKHAAA